MKRPLHDLLRLALLVPILLSVLTSAAPATAQDPAGDGESDDPAGESAATQADDDGADDTDASLDELLGTGSGEEQAAEEGDEAGESEGGDDDAGVRDRLMDEDATGQPADLSQLFLAAVEGMNRSATRLRDQHDPGLATQRIQEDVLLKLDTLIEQAQQQQSSQQQQQQQQQQSSSSQQPPPDPQQQNQPGSNAGQGQNQNVNTPPDLQQRDLDGRLSESRAEWGGLPQRVRDMLRQGRGDAAARMYQRLTELYYQRLAEESEP